MFRRHRYESKGSEGAVAEMSEKLTAKLQQMVCTLEVHAAFSMEWTEQVDRLEKLAKVIDKESRIEKESEQQTLWDGEELILRTLVENGKMNVCLLLLAEFKKAQRVRMMLHASEAPDFEDRCLTFERSTCTILLRVVQVLDISAFTDMIRLALENAVVNKREVASHNLKGTLEEQGFVMLHLVVKRLDDLGEDRVMGYVRKHQIFRLLATGVVVFAKYIDKECIADALRTLSIILQSDDYNVEPEAYLGGFHQVGQNFEVSDEVYDSIQTELDNMLQLNPKLRSEVFALRDFLRKKEWSTAESIESKLS